MIAARSDFTSVPRMIFVLMFARMVLGIMLINWVIAMSPILNFRPSLAIVELMRILIDQENLDWEDAWDITVKTFAYTNHTVMPEALETWKVSLFASLLPRHVEIIYEINRRFLEEVALRYPGDSQRLSRMSIFEEGDAKKIRMAHIAIIGSHSINGVSELHSNLIKTQLFKDFYEFFPQRFNNKTNGITQRRWLLKANHRQSALITSKIGDRWTTDLYQLEKILPLANDPNFCKKWQQAKEQNKLVLADYISRQNGIAIDPHSMFDVQIKRIHEYKRQLLFALFIISQYLKIKRHPQADFVGRTFILSGKAAPGYFMAKLIIKFINSIADVIDKDKATRDKIKIVFLENYRVSLAEKIFPASDLSEQISTAGTEASGTGCMKFMVNGALTIGTCDGANIEIAKAVGAENIFIFGLTVKDIENLRYRGWQPSDSINKSPILKEIIQLIQSNFFSPSDSGLFKPLTDNLTTCDPFFLTADFDSYCATQEKVAQLFVDKKEWTKKSIANVAKSGKFSSDRTIREYAKDIWNVPVKG